MPSGAHRRLVPRRDVGRGRVVHRVDAAQQPQVERRELVALRVVEGRQVGDVTVRQHVQLEGPARRERHEGGPVLTAQHDAGALLLKREDALEQVGRRAVDRIEQTLRARRDVRVRVDLAVRVVQGHPDRFAAVLEREHLLHAGKRRQCRGAVGPRLDHGAGAGD